MGDLMHNLFGGLNGAAGMQAAMNTVGPAYVAEQARRMNPSTKKIFHGNVEVMQVANGFVVNIGRKEGYEYETHIASSITEVNEIIAAQIVAFKLEDKS